MIRQFVSSSNIASIGYEFASQTLEVQFHNGAVYQYYEVPEKIYAAFLMAPSKGKYHCQRIKSAFRYLKIMA